MATYAPPTSTLTIFNPDVFLIGSDGSDFLAFPVAQGAETFPFGLSTTTLLAAGAISTSGTLTAGESTLDGASYSAGTSPAYEIEYPVNSGRFDFYTNSGGGTRTRGSKIDSTGVHTVSTLDTIDEVAGTLNIGTATLRTGAINIGTGADSVAAKTITIGNSTQATGTLNLRTRNINIGGSNAATINSDAGTTTITGTTLNVTHTGTISLGASTSSATIEIGNGASQSGAINIGTGTSAAKNITIGTGSGGTTLMRGSNVTLSTGSIGTLSLGGTNTGSTIDMGTSFTAGAIRIGGTVGGTTTIDIGSGSSQSGIISINRNGGGNTNINGWTINGSNNILNASGDIQIDTTGGASRGLYLGGSITTGAVQIAASNGQSGTISLGTGTGTKIINIGDATGTTVNLNGVDINASSLDVAGTLTAGASTLTSVISNTYNATAIGSAMTIGNNITTGSIDIGNTTTGGIGIGTTSGSGTISIGYSQPFVSNSNNVSILTGSNCSGTVNISTGNTATKTVNIGGTNTTVALVGSTITASRMAVAGTLSGAATTLTSCACNTYTGTTMTITPVTSLAIGGTTAANSPFFNNVGGTTSINGGTATQSIEIGHGQTSGVINIGNITSRTGAINMGFSGSTTTLTAYATTINLGDASTTGGVTVGVPLRYNFNAGTYGFTSAEMGYQITQTPTTSAVAGASATNMTGTFTLGNGVWTVVLTVLSNLTSYTAGCWMRLGLSKTSATFENDRIIDFNPNAGGNNYFTTTFIVQSSAAQTWYVIGQQSGITTTTGNTSIRVQQTRVA